MRRILAMLTPLFCAVALGTVLVGYAPDTAVTVSPSAPITATPMPACTNEDGGGMALCTYAGTYADIVSGDCAPDYVGGSEVSEVCVLLHGMPNGIADVNACTDEMTAAERNPKLAKELADNGWNVRECFLAMIEE